jgi:DNA-binding response OmpR family regulator
MHILIGDPDREFVTLLSYWLRSHGHEPLIAQQESALLTLWHERAPDLVLFDLSLPGANGPAFCRRLRLEGAGLIVALSESSGEEEEVRALELGADDYLAKPLSMRKVQARLDALFRRAGRGAAARQGSLVQIGATSVSLTRCEVIRNGHRCRLTPLEERLLRLLITHAGQVISTSFILQRIWDSEGTPSNLIKTHIHHLRQKIEPDPDKPRFLLTLPTVGYVLHLQEQGKPDDALPGEGSLAMPGVHPRSA